MVTKVHEATKPVASEAVSSNGQHMLSIEEILAADDTRSQVVSVPEWGGDVKLTALSSIARNRIGAAIRRSAGTPGEDEALGLFQARVVAASMGLDQSHVEALSRKSAAPMQRLYEVAARLSGIGDDAVEGAVEDLKGTPNGDSGSA